jgi:hypothetical protein
VRPKIGFCNCKAGVADDEELDRVSDVDLVGSERSALGPGRPIKVEWMKGRSRGYRVGAPSGKSALSLAFNPFNNNCDLIVATVVAGDEPVAQEQNSGFESSPSRVSTTRTRIPIPPLDFSGSSEKQRADIEDWERRLEQRASLLRVTPNDISADEWVALLRQYDEFEKELLAAGILSTTFAEGHKRLLRLSEPDLAPLLNADRSAKRDVTRLLRQNVLVELEREFNKQGPIDEFSRQELAMRFGLKPEQVERHHALDEYMATLYWAIYINAIESNLIDTTVASRLYSRTMYFENVKRWGMTPQQMRSQVQAELALALFKEKRYSEAKVAAYQSLAALGNAPEPYLVTDQDDDGHRTVRFSKNLAFVIAKFSDFKIADQTNEPAAGLRAAVELLEYSAPLDHILWYLLDSRQWAARRGCAQSHPLLRRAEKAPRQ